MAQHIGTFSRMSPIGLACLALFGAGTGLLQPAAPSIGVMLALPVLAAGLLWWIRRVWVGGLLIVGLGWLVATLHVAGALNQRLPMELAGMSWQVVGTVEGIPRHQEKQTRFTLRLDEGGSVPPAAVGKRVEFYWRDRHGQPADSERLNVRAGERWSFEARLQPPQSLSNPGGFDAQRHALASHVQGTGYVRLHSAKRLGDGKGLDHWREKMALRIFDVIGTEDSRFLRALTVGDTSAMQVTDWQRLRVTGLTHLIAISGFHVTLLGVVGMWLARALWWCFPALGRWLPRQQAEVAVALLGAGAYATAAGLGLPAVRTVIMVACVCLARGFRRTTTVWQCVGWAMLAVIVVDPLALLAAGFWLSFAGVAWLAWALGNTVQVGLRALVAAQGVATVGLLPLTVFLFGQASLVGPLANLLAIPWWSFLVVPLCIAGLTLETVQAGWGNAFWQVAAGLFAWSWSLVEWLSALEIAEVWLPESNLLAVALALIGAISLLLPRGLPGRGLALVLWIPLLWPQRGLPAEGAVEMHMLDVGQGQATVIRTHRHVLLFDAGPAAPDGFDAGDRVVVPALRALGIRKIDTLVVSHGDNDHAGGVPSVMAQVDTRWVHGPAGMDQAVVTDESCQRGMQWEWDGVQFRYLHPGPFFPYLGNESSCVLHIRGKYGAILLVGDIGHPVERLLVGESQPLTADVVQIGHHGSAGSSQGQFIRATGARLALVTAGANNRFGHPHPSVVRRWEGEGAEVIQTAQAGAIRVWIDDQGISVRERRYWHRRMWTSAY